MIDLMHINDPLSIVKIIKNYVKDPNHNDAQNWFR